jgi:hypothetical protein
MAAQNETLIEQVAGAHRDRDVDGRVRSHPAWYDLDAAERLEAFDAAQRQRKLEAALDPEGLSTTIKAVLARLRK